MDSKGNLLATTRSVVEIGVDPHSVTEEDWVKFGPLAELLMLPQSEIEEAAGAEPADRQDPVVFAGVGDPETPRHLEALFEELEPEGDVPITCPACRGRHRKHLANRLPPVDSRR